MMVMNIFPWQWLRILHQYVEAKTLKSINLFVNFLLHSSLNLQLACLDTFFLIKNVAYLVQERQIS